MNKKEKAFTLAETLITLTILGVVAAITVPNMVRKQVERTNRTKVKKAMAAYESALNKMVIENDLKSNSELSSFIMDNDCKNTSSYFKKVKDDGCIFKTSDGVWWRFNSENTFISLKNISSDHSFQNLREWEDRVWDRYNNEKNAFLFTFTYDKNGSLRVNDLSFEKQMVPPYSINLGYGHYQGDRYNILGKVYAFLYGESDDFYANGQMKCTSDGTRCYYSNGTLKSATYPNGGASMTTYEYSEDGSTIKETTFYKNNNGRIIITSIRTPEERTSYCVSCVDINGNQLISEYKIYDSDSKQWITKGKLKSVTGGYNYEEYNNSGDVLEKSTKYTIINIDGQYSYTKKTETIYHKDGVTPKQKTTYCSISNGCGVVPLGGKSLIYEYDESGNKTKTCRANTTTGVITCS